MLPSPKQQAEGEFSDEKDSIIRFHQVPWDARDQRGAPLAAGVYLTRLRHPDGAQTRRLLYLK